MKVKNFSENHKILVRDFIMSSAEPRKLLLPLKLPVPMAVESEIYYAALETYTKQELLKLFAGYSIPNYETVVAKSESLLFFSFQKSGAVNTVLHYKVTAQNGQTAKDIKLPVTLTNTEIQVVLSAYVSKGGAGLTTNTYKNLLINYRAWLQKNGHAVKELPRIIAGAVYRGII